MLDDVGFDILGITLALLVFHPETMEQSLEV